MRKRRLSEALNETSLEGLITKRKVSLGNLDTIASINGHRLSTKLISERDPEGRTGSTKKEGVTKYTSSVNPKKKKNSPRRRRERGPARRSRINYNAQNGSASFPESPFFELDSMLRPSAEINVQPGGAVPWVDITQEELEILGIPCTTDLGWDLEREQNNQLEETNMIEDIPSG